SQSQCNILWVIIPTCLGISFTNVPIMTFCFRIEEKARSMYVTDKLSTDSKGSLNRVGKFGVSSFSATEDSISINSCFFKKLLKVFFADFAEQSVKYKRDFALVAAT